MSLQPNRRSHRLAFIAVVVQFLPYVRFANGQQAYCWDTCPFNCPRVGPRLCPVESTLTYYDCCHSGCCQYIKWPNLLFLVIIIFLLLTGCGCCFFFLLTDARHRMFVKQNQEQQKQEEVAVTASEANTHTSQHVSPITKGQIRANIHHKQSTIV